MIWQVYSLREHDAPILGKIWDSPFASDNPTQK